MIGIPLLVAAILVLHGPEVRAGEENKDPHVVSPRSAIVHLFEWRWADIAEECERFLGPYGYAGIQISPPNEYKVITDPSRPWFERYQPVSYVLTTRSGDEAAFTDMVKRCNAQDVRIYVDTVINQMASGSGQGSAGSSYNSDSQTYPTYSGYDFHSCEGCPASCSIENYQDAAQVRNCRLSGMNDLNQGTDYVRTTMAAYLNKLVDIGVAGFRIDAAKHMWPNELGSLYDQLSDLNTDYFPAGAKPFIYQEVIDLGGEPITTSQYTPYGRTLQFKYPNFLGDVFRKSDQLKQLANFGSDWGMDAGSDGVVFVCNHDDQRGQGGGSIYNIITFFEPRLYKMATAFMLSWPYGFPRIMSSYRWDREIVNGQDVNYYVGPPHDDSGNILPVEINDDMTCAGDWVCEHRWRQIYNMVKFRNVAGMTEVQNWWDNGNNQIAFSRGNVAFIAINNDDGDMQQTLPTGLPAGSYCDVITGSLENGSCTGTVVEVDSSGNAAISLTSGMDDPMIAIHVEAKLDFTYRKRTSGN